MTWIFGYGSLIWRPDFPFEEKQLVRLRGHHRAFSRLSTRHRGTPEQPGMVVALEPGGECQGVAYRLAEGRESEVLAYLDDREGAGYQRTEVLVEMPPESGDGPVTALAYLPAPGHPTHAPHLSPERKVELIATGRGQSGTAYDYLFTLVEELKRLGIQDTAIESMAPQVRTFVEAQHPA